MIMLEVKDLCVSYNGLSIVRNVSFNLEQRQWLMIVGPNGAGKSTIINAISRGVPFTGKVICVGENVAAMKSARLARKLGVLAQNHYVGYSFSVEEVVAMGRYAHSRGPFRGRSKEDECKIDEALALTGMSEQRHQSVLTLSGGELQRTFLAQLFAQDPSILILDEPTNHLDLVYQKQIFTLIRSWIDNTGRAVLSVVHDLSLAKAYGTDAVLMSNGEVAASGKIDDVLTREQLKSVYGIDVYSWMRDMLSQWKYESEGE